MKLYELGSTTEPAELDAATTARLIRAFSGATRVRDPMEVALRSDLVEIEHDLYARLRKPSSDEIDAGVRYAVWPLAVVATVP